MPFTCSQLKMRPPLPPMRQQNLPPLKLSQIKRRISAFGNGIGYGHGVIGSDLDDSAVEGAVNRWSEGNAVLNTVVFGAAPRFDVASIDHLGIIQRDDTLARDGTGVIVNFGDSRFKQGATRFSLNKSIRWR